MKEYRLELPERLKNKEHEIKEYLLVKHWEDNIFQSGFCAKVLEIRKFDFQTSVLNKFGLSFMGKKI